MEEFFRPFPATCAGCDNKVMAVYIHNEAPIGICYKCKYEPTEDIKKKVIKKVKEYEF